jgi:hypothetical protein
MTAIRHLFRPLSLPAQARATASRAADMFRTAHAENADTEALLCAEIMHAVADGRARDAATAAQAWAVFQRARSV